MNTKLLEQIKKLKGVKMITPVEGNEIIVTFEPEPKQISGIFKTFMKDDQFVSFAGNERFLSDFPVLVLPITATKEAAELFYSKIAINDLELVTIEYTVRS